jgi:hypothetical protein
MVLTARKDFIIKIILLSLPNLSNSLTVWIYTPLQLPVHICNNHVYCKELCVHRSISFNGQFLYLVYS